MKRLREKDPENEESFLLNLLPELLDEIRAYLPPVGHVFLARTCRYFHQLDSRSYLHPVIQTTVWESLGTSIVFPPRTYLDKNVDNAIADRRILTHALMCIFDQLKDDDLRPSALYAGDIASYQFFEDIDTPAPQQQRFSVELHWRWWSHPAMADSTWITVLPKNLPLVAVGAEFHATTDRITMGEGVPLLPELYPVLNVWWAYCIDYNKAGDAECVLYESWSHLLTACLPFRQKMEACRHARQCMKNAGK